MTGRMLHEGLGKLHFLGTFLGASGVFLLMHHVGMAGMLRRTADPYVAEGLAHLREPNQWITWSALFLAAWQLLFFANIAWSLLAGRKAASNPWKANSLEWETAAGRGGWALRIPAQPNRGRQSASGAYNLWPLGLPSCSPLRSPPGPCAWRSPPFWWRSRWCFSAVR
jgi:hypothetical protein